MPKGNPTINSLAQERSEYEKLAALNKELEEKLAEKTAAYEALNTQLLLKQKYTEQLSAGLPLIVYTIDLLTAKVAILSTNPGNRIRFNTNPAGYISTGSFIKQFATTAGKKVNTKDFLAVPSVKEYQLYIGSTIFYVENKLSVFEATVDGSPKTLMGFLTDITETKIIRDRLEDSQKIAHIGNWEWHIKTGQIFWSNEIYKIFNVNKEEFSHGLPGFLNVVYPGDRQLVQNALELSLSTKTNYEIIHRIEPRPGVMRYIIEKAYTEYDKFGNPHRMVGTAQDITETKNIREMFEESQKHARIGTWEWNIAQNAYYCSKEMYSIFDTDATTVKLTHKQHKGFVYADDRELVDETLKNAIEKRESYDLVYRIISATGRLKYLNEKGSANYAPDGTVVKHLGTLRDITEKRVLKNELQSAFMTLQTSLNAVFTMDLKGNVQFANHAAVKMWGYSDITAMMIEKPGMLDYWSHADHPKIAQCFEDIFTSGTCNPPEPYTAIKQNGSEMLVKLNGATICDERGNPYAITGSFFDVTEEIKMKREVEEYDRKLNLLLGNIDEVVYGIEASPENPLNGKIFFLSGKAKELFSFNENNSSLSADVWLRSIHPDDIDILTGTTQQAVKEKRTVTREYRMRYPTESDYCWFEDKITPQFDTEGRLTAYFGSSRDITEKRKINELLKESEEKYRLISENNSDLITMRDMSLNALFVSNSVKQILGYDVKEYMAKSHTDLLHPDDAVPANATEEAIKKDLNRRTETRLKHKNGHYVWLQTFTQPVYDESGQIVHLVRSSRDITDRKKLELSILNSERKYRLIFENALVGIFRTDALTHKLLDANDVCVKLFGYATKEELLEGFMTGKHFKVSNERESVLRELNRNKTLQNRQIQFRKKDGSMFWGNTSVKLLSEEGVIEGVIIDITQSKIHEIELKKSLIEKDLLLKEVHHRVKNNLQVISSLIKLQLNKISDPVIREPLLETRQRIHTIALIHEKIYLSEDIASLNFSEYLHNMVRPLKLLHADKDVSVHFNLEPFYTNINIAVPLGLICYEIISNAFKHAFKIEKKGQIYLSVVKNNMAEEIIIADTGSGFDFSEVNVAKSLGWSLITNLTNQAKATLEIRSEKGLGSIFRINFLE